jgi:hypothetical protein
VAGSWVWGYKGFLGDPSGGNPAGSVPFARGSADRLKQFSRVSIVLPSRVIRFVRRYWWLFAVLNELRGLATVAILWGWLH